MAYEFFSDPKEGTILENGKRLVLESTTSESVISLVEHAAKKGWKRVRVRGDMEMVKRAWFEGSIRGIQVLGFSPTLKDREELARAQKSYQNERAILEPTTMRADTVAEHYVREVLPALDRECHNLRHLSLQHGIRRTDLDRAYGLNKPQSEAARQVDAMFAAARGKLIEAIELKEMFVSLGDKEISVRTVMDNGVKRYVPAHGAHTQSPVSKEFERSPNAQSLTRSK